MSIANLLFITAITLIINIIAHRGLRNLLLMLISILMIYWLQPSTPIRHLDFWLPTLTLVLAIIVWIITIPKDNFDLRSNLTTGAAIIVILIVISLTRYIEPLCCITPTRPPAFLQVLIPILLLAFVVFLAYRYTSFNRFWLLSLSILIIGSLIFLKSEPLLLAASKGLRIISGQSPKLASIIDIRWLGFSYVAFRLMHTMIDRLNGRLAIISLQEYIIYIIFYPAFSAGPIDRVQRFVQDLRQPVRKSIDDLLNGSKRVFIGIFRKFVLADGLALIALNSLNANQISSIGWLWIIVFAFALRIYFDFSGYTDIALGLGSLVGIQLPENFDRPYLKQNITLFWNSWHMTLAGWFRSYFFNPVIRLFRSQTHSLPFPLIILIGQLSTFVLIGLWHGISWNFAIWGAWHGVGLFIHNRWTELLRSRGVNFEDRPGIKYFVKTSGTLLTFIYVSLGWVWFVLSNPSQSLKTLLLMFGIS